MAGDGVAKASSPASTNTTVPLDIRSVITTEKCDQMVHLAKQNVNESCERKLNEKCEPVVFEKKVGDVPFKVGDVFFKVGEVPFKVGDVMF